MNKSSPFRIEMIVVTIISIVGLTSIFTLFLSAHPYFNPLQQHELPVGWVNEYTYVSSNLTVYKEEKVIETFRYAGAGGESTVIFSLQVISINEKGEVFIRFNGIDIGSTYVETPGVIEASVASCCFVSLVSAAEDNHVEILSNGFEGLFRYIIVIPNK